MLRTTWIVLYLHTHQGNVLVFFFETFISSSLNTFIAQHFRKALRSLERAGGVYAMVAPCAEVTFPDLLVGHLVGGEPLRVVLPKEPRRRPHETSSCIVPALPKTTTGYGVKLTFDVPQGKHNGQLQVRVCWHNVVYQSHVDFGNKYLRL
jgi:hypothetical protein